MAGLFITGTDTGVGKTFVAAAVVRRLCEQGLRVGAYKPAVSGAGAGPQGEWRWSDVEALYDALGGRFPRERICPQQFRTPLAPPVAARLEGRAVDSQLLRAGAAWWEGQADVLVVEGAGGLLAPLSETESVADLAVDLGLPLVIVARLGLGTLNHTLLTVEAAERRGLRVSGIVLNQATREAGDPSIETNPQELAARCAAPILGVFPFLAGPDLLQHKAFLTIDWMQLARGDGSGAA